MSSRVATISSSYQPCTVAKLLDLDLGQLILGTCIHTTRPNLLLGHLFVSQQQTVSPQQSWIDSGSAEQGAPRRPNTSSPRVRTVTTIHAPSDFRPCSIKGLHKTAFRSEPSHITDPTTRIHRDVQIRVEGGIRSGWERAEFRSFLTYARNSLDAQNPM